MKAFHMVAFGALLGTLSLAAIPSTGYAETTEKPAEKPKEKKAVTVPAGAAMMVKTDQEVSSKDKPGRKFSATLQNNLMSGDTVVAKAGTQVYGTVVESKEIGRGIVQQHSNLVLGLTDINIDGTMYPIRTGSFSEGATSVLLKKKAVVVPAGSLLEFKLTAPLTVAQ